MCGDDAYGSSGTHNNNVDCNAVGSTQTNAGTETANGFDPVPAGQDAVYGRDATHNDDSDGHAGFSFTKINSSGQVLADQSKAWEEFGSEASNNQWACVQDNVTGLMWEVKQSTGLHRAGDAYTWYSSDNSNNGGAVGYADNHGNICTGYNAADSATFCNTEAFVARVNGAGLCGFSDWRLPVSDELIQIVSYDRDAPAIDTAYFPNTRSSISSRYWSASPFAGSVSVAWIVRFSNGRGDGNNKSLNRQVRLVRGGQ